MASATEFFEFQRLLVEILRGAQPNQKLIAFALYDLKVGELIQSCSYPDEPSSKLSLSPQNFALDLFFQEAISLHSESSGKKVTISSPDSHRNRIRNWGRAGKSNGSTKLALETYYLLKTKSWGRGFAEKIDRKLFRGKSFEEAAGRRVPGHVSETIISPEKFDTAVGTAALSCAPADATSHEFCLQRTDMHAMYGRIPPDENFFNNWADLVTVATGQNNRNFLLVGEHHFFEKYHKPIGFFEISLMPSSRRADLFWSLLNTLARAFQDRSAFRDEQVYQLIRLLAHFVHVLDQASGFLHTSFLREVRKAFFAGRNVEPLFAAMFEKIQRESRNYLSFWHIPAGRQTIGDAHANEFEKYKRHLETAIHLTDQYVNASRVDAWYYDQRANFLARYAFLLLQSKAYAFNHAPTIHQFDAAFAELEDICARHPTAYQQHSYLDIARVQQMNEGRQEALQAIADKMERSNVSDAATNLVKMGVDAERLGDGAQALTFLNGEAGKWFDSRSLDVKKHLVNFGAMSITPVLREQLVEYFVENKYMSRIEASLTLHSRILTDRMDE